jgi:uncharacterized protein (DUF849 family)
VNGAAKGKRVVVAVAPNGGRRTKTDHPALPLTPGELARAAAECLEEGASMIHLHVRDSEGRHTLDPEVYRDATARIYGAVGDKLVVQITSESLGRYTTEQQKTAVLETNPEAVSLALREFAPDKAAEQDFGEFLVRLKIMRIWPQIILYSTDEAVRLEGMRRQGLIPFGSIAVLYVLGRFALSQSSTPRGVLPFLASDKPRFEHWSVCAFGRREAACVVAAALLGGNARVGFENNILLPDGALANSNADLVGAVARALEALGLETETADGLREEIATAMAK